MMLNDKIKILALTFLLANAYSACSWALKANFKLENLDGLLDKEVVSELNDKVKQKGAIDDERQLEKFAKNKELALHAILKSYGFYAAEVQHVITKTGKDTFLIKYQIEPHQVFVISQIDINHPDSITGLEVSQLKIKVGDRLVAKHVIQAAKNMALNIEQNNCFTSVEVEHQAILNFEDSTALLAFNIADRDQVTFGATEIVGLETVDSEYIIRQIPWKQGQCFKIASIKNFEKKLREKNIFAQVVVEYPLEADSEGQVPLTIQVKESLHRTIKIGLGYESDTGPGIYSSWVHRNFYHLGETVETSLKISPVLQELKASYLNPYFHHPDQSLSNDVLVHRTDTEQYDSLGVTFEANIHRKLTDVWSVQYGVGYQLSQVKEGGMNENFGLNYYPVYVSYNSRKDPLDPRQGMFFKLATAPYWDTFGHSSEFLKSKLELVKYISLGKSEYTVLAARAAGANIIGAPLKEIPADIRLYAGGGKSVRGYEYQSLGQSPDGTIPGGRSLVEVSFELRQQLNQTYGFVVFVDGGNVYQETTPDFSTPLRWAVGGGLRYYTGFGPLRFDVATPIDRRKGIDSTFQIYISIGQSF